MKLRLEDINSFPLPQFQQLGILCCRRLAHLSNDKRLAKALKKLELSVGPPANEQMRRDAFNVANSAYTEIYQRDNEMTVEASVACTLVCACFDFANPSLLGNFRSALSQAEAMNLDQIRSIEEEMLRKIEALA